MPPSTRAASAIAIAIALALVGCSSYTAGAGSDPNNPDQLEAITWWASGSEQTAFYSLVGEFQRQNPGIQFIDASVLGVGGAEARQSIAARLDADNPPDTFQAAAGAGLTNYIADGDLQDLTQFYADNGLADVYRADLLELLSVDDKIYSVPSDIHRVNLLWADNSLLRAAGVDPAVAPANIDAWLADLEKVRASGVEYPLALGNALTQVQLFESVLLADFGEGLYRNLWQSTNSWSAEPLHAAVDHYSRLLSFVDPSSGSKDWTATTRQVVDGDTAYVVMADYAIALFQRDGRTYDADFTAMPAPGTDGVFDFLANSFTMPVGAVHDKAAEAWLLTLSSAAGQKALNWSKGSISARIDSVAQDYPPYQQTAIASFQHDPVVPSLAHGVAASPDWTKAITTAVVKFGRDGHPEALVNALVAAAQDARG